MSSLAKQLRVSVIGIRNRLGSVPIFSMVLVAFMYMSAFAQTAAKQSYVIVGKRANGSTLTIRRSQTLLLELPVEMSSGASWEFAQVNKNLWRYRVLQEDEAERLRTKKILGPDENQLGKPTREFGQTEKQVLQLKPKRTGSSTVSLHEVRPWEPEIVKDTYTLHIVTTE